jgi:creatinine amidohydrolase
MRIEDMNWMDVESYLQHEDRLILVLGACEQHGYLSLLTDTKIPQALADAASQRTGVLVAPAVNFGVSPYFLTYPGTISLRSSTYLDLVEDVVRSVYGFGFRRLLFLNGHGGNDMARTRLTELGNQLKDLRLAWYAWWQSDSVINLAQKYHLTPAHASWMEAFSFTRVADLPQGEKPLVSPKAVLNAEETRMDYGDGVFGGAYQVSDAIMDELFTACLKDVLDLFEFALLD